jgi:hypothetical protein
VVAVAEIEHLEPGDDFPGADPAIDPGVAGFIDDVPLRAVPEGSDADDVYAADGAEVAGENLGDVVIR